MLKRALIGILLNSAGLFLIVEFLSEVTASQGIKVYLIGGIILGILNTFIKPIMKILSLPFVLITAGLFLIVINAFILYLTQWFINVMDFQDTFLTFETLGAYLIAGIILGVINWATNIFLKH